MQGLQRERRSASTFTDVAMALTSNLQPQNLYHNIASLAARLVPCEWCTLYVADAHSRVLYQVLKGGGGSSGQSLFFLFSLSLSLSLSLTPRVKDWCPLTIAKQSVICSCVCLSFVSSLNLRTQS